jgi:hypothetical protein
MTPLNLVEEKKKFFNKNCRYNPHFKYSDLITLRKRGKYGQPKPKFLKLAKKIVEQAFAEKTIEEIRQLEGEKITQTQAKTMLDDFLLKNKLKDIIEVAWSDQFIASCSYYKNQLKIQLPLQYHKNEFKATLYHELGTHAIRRLNYVQQPFFKQKNKYNFHNYLRTEEGLASLNSLVAKNFKLNYLGAVNYIGINVAQHNSFVKTFEYFMKYLNNKEKAWRRTVKHKRGLYDTSKPGGFTKDVVYFEGMIEIWDFLQKSDFDLEGLYYGKISYQDIEKARQLNPDYEVTLPSFMVINKKLYRQQIINIGRINHLTQFEL